MNRKKIAILAIAGVLLFFFLTEPEPQTLIRRRQQTPTEPTEGPGILTVLKGTALAAGLATGQELIREGITDTVDLVKGEAKDIIAPTSSFGQPLPPDTSLVQKASTTIAKKAAQFFNADPAFDLAGFFNGVGEGSAGITEGGAVFVDQAEGLVSIESQFNLPTQIIPGEIVGGAEEFVPGITGNVPGEGLLSPTFAGIAGAGIGAAVGFGLSQLPILGDLKPFTAGVGLIVGGSSAVALGASAGAVALGTAIGGIGIIGFGLFSALSAPDRKKLASKAGVEFAVQIKPALDQMATETEKAGLPIVLLGNLNEMVKQLGPTYRNFLANNPFPLIAVQNIDSVLNPTFARFDALFARFGASPSAGLTRNIFHGSRNFDTPTVHQIFAIIKAVHDIPLDTTIAGNPELHTLNIPNFPKTLIPFVDPKTFDFFITNRKKVFNILNVSRIVESLPRNILQWENTDLGRQFRQLRLNITEAEFRRQFAALEKAIVIDPGLSGTDLTAAARFRFPEAFAVS